MGKHTQRKWYALDDGGEGGFLVATNDDSDDVICKTIPSPGIPVEEEEANAKFIAVAVNSYDQLVEALKIIAKPGHDSDEEIIAKEALKAAGEES